MERELDEAIIGFIETQARLNHTVLLSFLPVFIAEGALPSTPTPSIHNALSLESNPHEFVILFKSELGQLINQSDGDECGMCYGAPSTRSLSLLRL